MHFTTRYRPARVAAGATWVALALALAGAGGCGKPEPDRALLQLPDSCTVALAPDAADDDRVLTALRDKARVHQAETHMERLGWAYVSKARTDADAGFYVLAEHSALCIEASRPESGAAHLLRAHALYSQHRFADAEALARALVEQRGLSVDYAVYGDALLAQGETEQAIEAYQRMMDLSPGPHAYSRAAHVRWLKGDVAGAIELMELTAGASGSHDPGAGAWAYERLAAYELQAGNRRRATTMLARALELHPDYAPALLARGLMLLQDGHLHTALAVLERAAALNPLPAYQWALIEALQSAGRDADARERHALLMARGAADDRRTFALYLASTGHSPADALQLAERELGVRRDVFTLDAYAWALRALGRIDEARAASTQALREGTRDARLHLHAGVIARQAGDPRAATRWLESARALRHALLPSEQRLLDSELATLPGGGPVATSTTREG